MPTLSEHIRRLWAERSHCISPNVPADLPDFARDLAASPAWHEARMARAGAIDSEIDEAIKALRELGITA